MQWQQTSQGVWWYDFDIGHAVVQRGAFQWEYTLEHGDEIQIRRGFPEAWMAMTMVEAETERLRQMYARRTRLTRRI